MNEELYDKEIAPALRELAEKCRAAGMSFTATVEYAYGEMGSTFSIQDDAGIGMKIAAWAAACDGNVDSLMIKIQRHAREHGHSSIVLDILERNAQRT